MQQTLGERAVVVGAARPIGVQRAVAGTAGFLAAHPDLAQLALTQILGLCDFRFHGDPFLAGRKRPAPPPLTRRRPRHDPRCALESSWSSMNSRRRPGRSSCHAAEHTRDPIATSVSLRRRQLGGRTMVQSSPLWRTVHLHLAQVGEGALRGRDPSSRPNNPPCRVALALAPGAADRKTDQAPHLSSLIARTTPRMPCEARVARPRPPAGSTA